VIAFEKSLDGVLINKLAGKRIVL